ncbi:MAG: hypothetical protein IKE69_11635 [Thermoguttaceae bacterium]|nr:hypothetical protein [Thermoguttaceae bacterium]
MEVIDPRKKPDGVDYCFELRRSQLECVIDRFKKKFGKGLTAKREAGVEIYFRYRNSELKVTVFNGDEQETIPVTGTKTDVDFRLGYPFIRKFIKGFRECEKLTKQKDTIWEIWRTDDELVITPKNDTAVYNLPALITAENIDVIFEGKTKKEIGWHQIDPKYAGVLGRGFRCMNLYKGDDTANGILINENTMKLIGTEGRFFYTTEPVPVDYDGKHYLYLFDNDIAKFNTLFSLDNDDTVTRIEYGIMLDENGNKTDFAMRIQTEKYPEYRTVYGILASKRYRINVLAKMANEIHPELKVYAYAKLNAKVFNKATGIAVMNKTDDIYTLAPVDENHIKVGNTTIEVDKAINIRGDMIATKFLSKIFTGNVELLITKTIAIWTQDRKEYFMQAYLGNAEIDKYLTAPITLPEQETDTMKKTETKKTVAKKANQETAKAVRKKIAEKCGEKFVSDHVIVMSMPEPKKVKPKAKRKEVKKENKRTPKTENRITDYTGIVLYTDPPKIKEEVKIPTVKAERKLNRTELGECMASNQTMELYRNEELKRYRLAFNRRLTQEERDYLWNHKWTWRREFKCYQWGCTKNGAKECEEVIEYFKNR